MAAIPSDIEVEPAQRNSRLNEIIAIALVALALLLGLCLASYNPNDPSWNAAGETVARNWVGTVGANVAAALFQSIGLAAYLLPFLIIAAAWRRFRARRINAPLLRIAGLTLLVFSSAALLSLANIHPLQDASFNAGGLAGSMIARLLVGGLNTIGATILLTAVAITAVLLTTNLSFTNFYQTVIVAVAQRFAGLRSISERFRAWRQARRERRQQKRELRAQAKLQNSASASASIPIATTQIRGTEAVPHPELAEAFASFSASAAPAKTMSAAAGAATAAKRSLTSRGKTDTAESAVIEDMVRGAGAKRTTGAAANGRMPGKPHVGIEVPNPRRETIFLREVIESRAFRESPSKLTIALGKTIDGLNYVSDLAKMPHLLIAGTTGSGKSVGVNSLLLSILYRARPDEVKLILIDPKRLELGLYEDIPHLATPIIVDPKPAARALRWAVAEMERRYKELAGWGVRNIDGYNAERDRRNTVKDFDENGEAWTRMPYIVIIIDELADLMMTSGHEVEDSITRLAQMARAVGIHLVLATQRPSVDVITGLIKANFPSRISYRVSSKVDSRTILDTNGAEHLLGKGDMLFLPPGSSRLLRVHGAYVDESEINRVVSHIKAQWEPDYDETITQSDEEAMGLEDSGGERDELFEDALRIVVDMKRASTSVLQRRLRIGYGRAAAVLDQMEREGLIGKADGARPRPVLARAIELVAEWEEQEA